MEEELKTILLNEMSAKECYLIWVLYISSFFLN